MKKLYVFFPLLVAGWMYPQLATAQSRIQPSSTYYLDHSFRIGYQGDELAYVADRYQLTPTCWIDSVFYMDSGYLRQVMKSTIRSEGDTSVATKLWQPNSGQLQLYEEWVGRKKHGKQAYYDATGRLRQRYTYNMGEQLTAEGFSTTGSPEVREFQESMPQYPGGAEGLLNLIGQRLQYPLGALLSNGGGKVYVRWAVDETGQMRNPKVIKSVSPELDAECLRVLKTLPSCEPARCGELPIATTITMPITFAIKARRSAKHDLNRTK